MCQNSRRFVDFVVCGARVLLTLVRLLAFVFLLMPGFIVFAWYYFVKADRIALPYRDEAGLRHFMDLYGGRSGSRHVREEGGVDSNSAAANTTTAISVPSPIAEEGRLKPVIIFLTGGGWIIGYKMWGALLARALVPNGCLVAIPDYRNFPQVTVGEMISDVDDAVQWTLDNCQSFGGDPNRVVIVGQSAGAHLGSCILLRKALQEIGETPLRRPASRTTYRASDICGFVAASGPYNLVSVSDSFHKHGLDNNIIYGIFSENLERYSPIHLVKQIQEKQRRTKKGRHESGATLVDVLPPFCIIHGTSDETVPYNGAVKYANALSGAGVRVKIHKYQKWSHTDPILEAPMSGNHRFHRDVHNFVRHWTTRLDTTLGGRKDAELMPFDEAKPECRPICPGPLIAAGRLLNPL